MLQKELCLSLCLLGDSLRDGFLHMGAIDYLWIDGKLSRPLQYCWWGYFGSISLEHAVRRRRLYARLLCSIFLSHGGSRILYAFLVTVRWSVGTLLLRALMTIALGLCPSHFTVDSSASKERYTYREFKIQEAQETVLWSALLPNKWNVLCARNFSTRGIGRPWLSRFHDQYCVSVIVTLDKWF